MGTAAIEPAGPVAGSSAAPGITIRALAEIDLPEAERIFGLAFGTFLGAPEPETFWSDRDYVHGRWAVSEELAL